MNVSASIQQLFEQPQSKSNRGGALLLQQLDSWKQFEYRSMAQTC